MAAKADTTSSKRIAVEHVNPVANILNGRSKLLGVTDVEILNSKEGEFLFLKAKLEGNDAIVKIRKSMPSADEIVSRVNEFLLEEKFANKAWGGFKGDLNSPGFNVDLYVPAAETTDAAQIEKMMKKQVDKLRYQEHVLVTETPGLYASKTKAYIEGLVNDCQWVQRIVSGVDLSGIKDCYDIVKDGVKGEKVIYSDPEPAVGFGLFVDFKWKGHPKSMEALREVQKGSVDVKSIYGLALPMRNDIRSLRDLTGEHIPMLENILTNSKKAMQKLYGVEENKLRMFVHYQPQYYYFHVHVTAMDIDFGVNAEKAHLLETIIANLKIDPKYYQKITLVFSVPKTHPICN